MGIIDENVEVFLLISKGLKGLTRAGLPERGAINIDTPLAHPRRGYVNVENSGCRRLRIHLSR